MKDKFFHPYTEKERIVDIDNNWLTQQIDHKGFDVNNQYLKCLSAIANDTKDQALNTIANAVTQSGGTMRFSSLLERVEAAHPRDESNVISQLILKSKKAKEFVNDSIIYGGMSDCTPSSRAKENILVIDTIEFDETEFDEDNDTAISVSQERNVDILLPLTIKTANQSSAANSESSLNDESQPENLTTETEVSDRVELIEPIKAPIQLTEKTQSFTSWLNSLPQLKSENPFSQEPVKPTKVFSIISEPIASLLAKQGHTEDAVAMYEQLKVKYPEKSSFFARQIENLK